MYRHPIWKCLLFSFLLSFIGCQNNTQISQENVSDFSTLEKNVTSKSEKHMKFDYTTKVIKNEFIVIFDGYYEPGDRKNFITSALNQTDVKKWSILPRDNPAKGYPSDFDLIFLDEVDKQSGIEALLKHPQVKTVTSQKLVKRTLKWVEETEEKSEFSNFKRKLYDHVRDKFF